MSIDKEIQEKIVRDIIAERVSQDIKFGPRNNFPPERWIVILAEEFGEVSNAILEKDLDNYYIEFVQVAAVALAALECFIRQMRKIGEIRNGYE